MAHTLNAPSHGINGGNPRAAPHAPAAAPFLVNVDDVVAAHIEAARVRIQAAKRRREELSAARARGLAARHAAKLRRLNGSDTKPETESPEKENQ